MSGLEIPLGGGYINAVVRVGSTVRREIHEPRPFAQELLGFFERLEWPGAPRFQGFDERGREVLTYIEGHVPWAGTSEPDDVWSPESVARVAELTREFHDLTANSHLVGDAEVVCHNDLSPKNTVYQIDREGRLRPAAFIDWDIAAPGRRIHDVAHVAWQWACGPTSSVDGAVTLLQVIAESYGCSSGDRAELVAVILWWQERCWRGIQAKIDARDPSVQRLQVAGAVEAVQADWAWTLEHRHTLEVALRG